MEEKEYLSPVQLGRLLPLLPHILGLLKELNPYAADLFLEGQESDTKTVNYVMSDLLNTLNFNGDLSMMELRFSFASYKVEVWLTVVRTVLLECWPRLVPDKTASALLGSLTMLNNAQSSMECAHIIGPLLDQIPRTRFRVLGEFCAFLRDCSTAPEDLSCLTGPFLLLPSNTLTSSGTSVIASQTAASAAVMDLLVQECEILFGRIGCVAPTYPLGVRPKQTTGRRSIRDKLSRFSLRNRGGGGNAPAPPPGLGGNGRRPPPAPPRVGGNKEKQKKTLLEKRKLGLKVFYMWRDPRRKDKVDVLFNNYEFEEIALAIQRKYFMLPPGWSQQLDYMLMMGNQNLGWYQRLKQGILPAPLEIEVVGQNRARGGSSQEPIEETKIDKVVNEIGSTETTFNQSMRELVAYGNLLKEIASGQRGSAAAKALGMSEDIVEQVFGARLIKIMEVSNNLLSDLEVVTLVKVQPKGKQSRIQLVSRVFIELSQQLYVFSPFSCAHKQNMMHIRAAKDQLEQTGGGGLRRLGSFFGSDSNKNFLEIWWEMTQDSDVLRGQTLESTLIMPIQRVPRYKLLLEELQKSTPKNDSSYVELCEAVEVVRALAVDINEAIRAHERLMKKFGDDIVAPMTHKVNKKGMQNVYR